MSETFAKDEPVGLKNPTNLYNCNRNSNFSFFYPNLSKDKQDKMAGSLWFGSLCYCYGIL